MTLQETIEQIHPLSKEAMDRAKAHWDGIAKPLHSLGKLEDVLIQIAGITGKEEISIEKRALLTFCADNGVVEENVTQSGQEVTATVAENFLQEKATAAILCRGSACGSGFRLISEWRAIRRFRGIKLRMEQKIWQKVRR